MIRYSRVEKFLLSWETDAVTAFVKKIDLLLADKLRRDLADQGFELSTPAYTLFSAKKKGVCCTLYASGKLMVQGKDKGDFITYYLEPQILKDFSFSYPQTALDMRPRIGIDEAGKGDFFGPLCVAGVCANQEGLAKLAEYHVRDSKRITDAVILKIASQIKSILPHTVIRLFPKRYNELYGKFRNLNRLLGWMHASAIEELALETGYRTAIIDQFASEDVVQSALERKGVNVDLTQRYRAEEDPVVAAASILARASFLEGIKSLSNMVTFPLPKGAGSQVIEAGKRVLMMHGEDMLSQVSKMHFKTAHQIRDA